LAGHVTLRRLDRLNLKLSTELPVSAVAGEPAGVKSLVMALLPFVESAPRASRLKVGTPTFSEIQQNPGHPPAERPLVYVYSYLEPVPGASVASVTLNRFG
jgi:hypothetical protein